MTMNPPRFNLWVTYPYGSSVVCYGDQGTLNAIALTAGIEGDVYVLPDGQEPGDPPQSNTD